MARSLCKLAPFCTTTTAATSRTSLRLRSTQPEALGRVARTAKEEAEKVAIKKLEEAVHRIIVKRAEPGWMSLVPGGSYWVPPATKARGFVDLVDRLVMDLASGRQVLRKNDHAFRLSSNRGWPSSAHYFKGASHSPLEGEMTTTNANKSEEEEG